MNLKEAAAILKEYQEWRMGADTEMLNPKKISEAISVILDHLLSL